MGFHVLPWASVPSASRGSLVGIDGHQWVAMGLTWAAMSIHASPVGFHGRPWVSSELPRTSMDLSWAPMGFPLDPMDFH